MHQFPDDPKFDLVHSYSRAEAIDDGLLIDVSEHAKEVGIKYPVAVTTALWHDWIQPLEADRQLGQSEAGRLHDVLWLFVVFARKTPGDHLEFQVIFVKNGRQKKVWVKAICGPGDDPAPVITLMLRHED